MYTYLYAVACQVDRNKDRKILPSIVLCHLPHSYLLKRRISPSFHSNPSHKPLHLFMYPPHGRLVSLFRRSNTFSENRLRSLRRFPSIITHFSLLTTCPLLLLLSEAVSLSELTLSLIPLHCFSISYAEPTPSTMFTLILYFFPESPVSRDFPLFSAGLIGLGLGSPGLAILPLIGSSCLM